MKKFLFLISYLTIASTFVFLTIGIKYSNVDVTLLGFASMTIAVFSYSIADNIKSKMHISR